MTTPEEDAALIDDCRTVLGDLVEISGGTVRYEKDEDMAKLAHTLYDRLLKRQAESGSVKSQPTTTTTAPEPEARLRALERVRAAAQFYVNSPKKFGIRYQAYRSLVKALDESET